VKGQLVQVSGIESRTNGLKQMPTYDHKIEGGLPRTLVNLERQYSDRGQLVSANMVTDINTGEAHAPRIPAKLGKEGVGTTGHLSKDNAAKIKLVLDCRCAYLKPDKIYDLVYTNGNLIAVGYKKPSSTLDDHTICAMFFSLVHQS